MMRTNEVIINNIDGNSVNTCADQLRRVGRGDATDSDDRHGEALFGAGDQIQRWPYRVGLDAGCEKTAERNMVGAGSQCRFGQLQPVVTGGAEQFAGPEPGAGCSNITIVTAEMQSCSIDRDGDIQVIIDDQRNAARGAQRLQCTSLGEPQL